MIEIIDGQIFVDGKETNNPELIGYALIDFAKSENTNLLVNNKSVLFKNKGVEVKNKYIKYLENNDMKFTHERKILIDLVSKTNNFDPIDLLDIARESRIKIVPATCYNFLQTCVEADVLEIQPKKYLWK